MTKLKILGSFLLVLQLLFLLSCNKKTEDVVTEDPAIIGIIDAELYSAPDGKILVTKLNDGTKVICLNKSDPQPRAGENEESAGTQSAAEGEPYYKIRIPENNQTGWVKTSALAFKVDDEKNAFVTGEPWLYEKLNSGSLQLFWGKIVKYLGYKIYHDWERYNWKGMELWRVDAGGKEGWVIASYLLPDAFPGIMLEDADLFVLPADRKQNINGSVQKMDIIPVIDKGTKGWITIRPPGKNKDFFISASKGDPISYKEEDFTIASYLKDIYFESKAIVDQVNAAYKTSDPDAEIARITEKDKKIEILTTAEEEFKEKLAKYNSSYNNEDRKSVV